MAICDQSWLELEDIRCLRYGEQDWIPIYGFKYGAEHLEFPEIGHFEEFQEFRGAAIFKKYQKIAEEITSWNTWSNDNYYPCYSDEHPYKESHQFNDSEDNNIGFRLAVGELLPNDNKAQVHLFQDFALVYELKFEGNTWIRPKSGNEQVVKFIFDGNNEIQRVEIRSSYLKEYLQLRGAYFRLYYYTGRRFVQKNMPKFDWKDEKTISELPNDRCHAYIEHIDLHGERLPKVLITPSTQEHLQNYTEKLPPQYAANTQKVTTVAASSTDRYFVYSRMWRGEWINPSDTIEHVRTLEI